MKDGQSTRHNGKQANTGRPPQNSVSTYRRQNGGIFEWAEVPAEEIGKLIQAVCGRGRAIICGTTSNGGALSITVLDGDSRIREWPSSIETFRSFADWVPTELELD